MRRFVLLIVAAGFIAGCSKEAGPPIDISGVRILAPVPGSRMGVAYMTIANDSGDTMIITAARSPQFERVEMHETLIEDGVSTMRELEELTIENAAGRGQKPLQVIGSLAGGRGSPGERGDVLRRHAG